MLATYKNEITILYSGKYYIVGDLKQLWKQGKSSRICITFGNSPRP